MGLESWLHCFPSSILLSHPHLAVSILCILTKFSSLAPVGVLELWFRGRV